MFKKNKVQSEGTTLQLLKQDSDRATLTNEDKESHEDVVGFCLVGRFLGRFPGWRAVNELTRRWQTPHMMLTHDSAWLIFKFPEKQSCDAILKGGPYVACGCPLYIKAMPSCFTFESTIHNQLPLWMKIYGLPIDCWSMTRLSKVTSLVGNPLFTNR